MKRAPITKATGGFSDEVENTIALRFPPSPCVQRHQGINLKQSVEKTIRNDWDEI
jgi:hypothetical protein